jgi:hypothetical protein
MPKGFFEKALGAWKRRLRYGFSGLIKIMMKTARLTAKWVTISAAVKKGSS